MAGTILCSGQPVTVHATAVTSENGQAAASDDNSLSSLSLSEGQISPALQAGVTKYTATVPNDVTEVEVSARRRNAESIDHFDQREYPIFLRVRTDSVSW